jgi:purine-binding chemotaxis protein CheW
MIDKDQKQSELNILSFFLDEWEYGLDIEKVREIIRMVEITPVPETPDFLAGIINFRGEIVPIVDLRRRLGLKPQEYSLSTPIIVSDIDGRTTGIIVDRVSEVLAVTTDEICQPSSEIPLSKDLIEGILRLDGRLLLLLDLKKVLTFERQKIIAKVKKLGRTKRVEE